MDIRQMDSCRCELRPWSAPCKPSCCQDLGNYMMAQRPQCCDCTGTSCDNIAYNCLQNFQPSTQGYPNTWNFQSNNDQYHNTGNYMQSELLHSESKNLGLGQEPQNLGLGQKTQMTNTNQCKDCIGGDTGRSSEPRSLWKQPASQLQDSGFDSTVADRLIFRTIYSMGAGVTNDSNVASLRENKPNQATHSHFKSNVRPDVGNTQTSQCCSQAGGCGIQGTSGNSLYNNQRRNSQPNSIKNDQSFASLLNSLESSFAELGRNPTSNAASMHQQPQNKILGNVMNCSENSAGSLGNSLNSQSNHSTLDPNHSRVNNRSMLSGASDAELIELMMKIASLNSQTNQEYINNSPQNRVYNQSNSDYSSCGVLSNPGVQCGYNEMGCTDSLVCNKGQSSLPCDRLGQIWHSNGTDFGNQSDRNVTQNVRQCNNELFNQYMNSIQPSMISVNSNSRLPNDYIQHGMGLQGVNVSNSYPVLQDCGKGCTVISNPYLPQNSGFIAQNRFFNSGPMFQASPMQNTPNLNNSSCDKSQCFSMLTSLAQGNHNQQDLRGNIVKPSCCSATGCRLLNSNMLVDNRDANCEHNLNTSVKGMNISNNSRDQITSSMPSINTQNGCNYVHKELQSQPYSKLSDYRTEETNLGRNLPNPNLQQSCHSLNSLRAEANKRNFYVNDFCTGIPSCGNTERLYGGCCDTKKCCQGECSSNLDIYQQQNCVQNQHLMASCAEVPTSNKLQKDNLVRYMDRSDWNRIPNLPDEYFHQIVPCPVEYPVGKPNIIANRDFVNNVTQPSTVKPPQKQIFAEQKVFNGDNAAQETNSNMVDEEIVYNESDRDDIVDEKQQEAYSKNNFYRVMSPKPLRRQGNNNVNNNRVKHFPSLAFRFYIEQHAENVSKYQAERKERLKRLNDDMTKLNLSEVEMTQLRQLLFLKESHHLRLRRTKMEARMFERLAVLGSGAFGDVYLVRKRDTLALYAMKSIRKQEVLKRRQIAHVKAERDILAEADNDWVVKLYYSFQDSTCLYFVMDYVPGGDMMGLLMKLEIFDEELSRFYISELVLALQSVHKLGFIHRDIKPDNILIDKSGHIKLTDFGLCTGFHWTHDSSYYRRGHIQESAPLSSDEDDVDDDDDSLGPNDTAGSQKWLGGVAINLGSTKIGSNCVNIPASALQRLIPHFMGGPSPDAPTADGGSFGTGRGFGTKLNSLGNHQSCLMPGMKLAQHHSGQLGNNNDDSLDFDERRKEKENPFVNRNKIQSLESKRRNVAKSLVGTPNYIAPEVLLETGYTACCDWWSVGVILYEMRVGQAPFVAESALETQLKVVNWRTTLRIPPHASLKRTTTDLILALCTDPAVRLGREGAKQVMAHPYFRGVDFNTIQHQQAPFVPHISHATDTSNFDSVDPARLKTSADAALGAGAGHFEEAFLDFTFRRFFEDESEPVGLPRDHELLPSDECVNNELFEI